MKRGQKIVLLLSIVLIASIGVASYFYFKPAANLKTQDVKAGKDIPFGREALKINGEFISEEIFSEEKSKLYMKVSRQGDMMRKTEEELNDMVLDEVISRALVENYLYHTSGVKISSDDVNTHINRYIKTKFATPEQFSEFMAESNYKDENELKKSIELFLLRLKVLPGIAKEYGIMVDTKAIDEAYQVQKDINTSVTVKHIFISLKNHTEDEAKRIADTAYSQFQSGKSFESLAKELSEDPETKDNGGIIGAISISKFKEAFEKSPFDVETGKVLKPFKTALGYEILFVERISEFSPPKSDVANNLLVQNFYTSDKFELWIDKLKSGASIEITDPSMGAFRSYIKGEFLKAATLYETAFGKYEQNMYLQKAADSYVKAKDWDSAIRVSTQGIDKESSNVYFYLYHAKALHHKNKTKEALSQLEKAEKKLSGNIEYMEKLSETYLELGYKNDADRIKKDIQKL